MNEEEIEKAKNDPLLKKIDRHLAKVAQEEFINNLHHRLGYLGSPPPIWFIIALVCASLFFYYVIFHSEFITYLAKMYLNKN